MPKICQDSDYALNRYSPNIVFRTATGIVEVTLADFLTENRSMTEADFRALKEFSDADYMERDRNGFRQTRKNISFQGFYRAGVIRRTARRRFPGRLQSLRTDGLYVPVPDGQSGS